MFRLKHGSNCWLPATQAFVRPKLWCHDAATHAITNYGADRKWLKEHACTFWIGPAHSIKLGEKLLQLRFRATNKLRTGNRVDLASIVGLEYHDAIWRGLCVRERTERDVFAS